MHSSPNSDHPSRSPEAKLFHVKFPDLHISKEDSVKPWCHRLEAQLFEAEYLADEDPRLMPTDVSAVVDASQQKAFRVNVLRQLARESDGAGLVETRWNLVVQPFVRTLIVEHVAKVIEAALLCAKGCCWRLRRVLLQRKMHPLMATILLRSACLSPLMYDPKYYPA